MSPRRAPAACPRPGCRRSVPCPDHPAARWGEGQRGRVMPPGWSATVARVLARDHHACRLRLPGCIGQATEVDHDDTGADDDTALRSACGPCHRRRTADQATLARGARPKRWDLS